MHVIYLLQYLLCVRLGFLPDPLKHFLVGCGVMAVVMIFFVWIKMADGAENVRALFNALNAVGYVSRMCQ